MFIVVVFYHAVCHYAECCYAECINSECGGASEVSIHRFYKGFLIFCFDFRKVQAQLSPGLNLIKRFTPVIYKCSK